MSSSFLCSVSQGRRGPNRTGSRVFLLRDLWLLRLLVAGDLLPELTQRPGEESRHVHLGDPQLLGDPGLAEPPEEPQVQDAPLPRRKPPENGSHTGPALQHLERLVLGADLLNGAGSLV